MKSPSQSNPWIGRLLSDRQRYRLDKRIAVGGMGEIFLAMDTLLGKQVALKLIKDTLVESEDLRKRFEWEVALCAALKSDHIVEVSDSGVTDEGYPFFVMEYLRGQSLGQLLRQKQRLSVEQTVNIITQVCDGLRLAHEGVTLWHDKGKVSKQIKVVHRDLKPDNIFLVPTTLGELVKILDFGIAKIREAQVEHTNLTNTFLGTFHYAAPEQLEVEKDLDERADIYSLGVILYEMLSGTDPFGLGFNINDVPIGNMSWASAHKFKPPVPLQIQPGLGQLSPELEAVVIRCLQKVPNERFASVNELKQALQAAAIPNTHQQLQQSLEETENIIGPIEPHQQLQQSLEETKDIIGPIEPKVVEQHNFKPILPVDEPQAGGNPRKVRQLLLTTTAAMTVVVSMGLGWYYYNKGQTNQFEKKALENIQLLKAGKNYEECVNKAKAVSQTSPFYAVAQNLLNECQTLTQEGDLLAKAKELAQEKNFKDALFEVSKIQPDSSSFQAAQPLIIQWSLNLFKQAEELYKQSYKAQSLENAIGMTKAIPKTSSVAKNAEERTNNWRTEWNNNENYLQAAQSALKQDKWQEAIDETNKVRLLGQQVKQDTPYWQNKMKPTIEMAQKLIAASKIQGGGTRSQTGSTRRPTQRPSTNRPIVRSPVPSTPKPQSRPRITTRTRPIVRPPAPSKPKPRKPLTRPLSREGLIILCRKFPKNSRCR